MNTEECCNHNCNQGRDCPLHKKELTDAESIIKQQQAKIKRLTQENHDLWEQLNENNYPCKPA